jgi:iron complex outermembrane receptor protein
MPSLAVAVDAEMADIEEIVVTADLRGGLLQEIPTSVSVIGRDAIAARGAQHIEEVLSRIPNVNFASGTSRARFFQIRGIGERSQFIDPLNPSVGFLIDNVDFSGAGSIGTLFDVSQVEVLRGPQGTRYGANGLAGLINIKTAEPTSEFEGRLQVGAGDYASRNVGAVVSGALSDAVRGRIAIETASSDGYMDNAFLGADDTNDRSETTARVKLDIAPSDETLIKLSFMHVDMDNGYDAFSLDNTRTTLSDNPGHDRQDSNALSIDGNWRAGDITIQAIGALSRSDLAYGYDEDWAFEGLHDDGYASIDNYLRNRDSRSLELRLKGNADHAIDWVIGIYQLSVDEDLRRVYTFAAGDFTSNHNVDTLAIFGETDIALGDDWSLNVGGRLEQRDAAYRDSNAVAFSPKENLWGGRVALTYHAGRDRLAYASLARGYKAGGFNTDGSLDADLREFDPEDLIEVEVGIKGQAGPLRYQLAVFYDKRRDQQVKSSLTRTRADGSTEFIDFNGNAARGTNKGLEADLQWQATEQLALFATVGLLDASFDRFINEFDEDLSGRRQAHAPRYTANFGASVTSGNWRVQVDADLKDEFFYSDRHHVKSNSDYTLLNASAHWQIGSVDLRLWARNLTDEDYSVRAFGSFGNDPRKGYVTEPYFQWGEPRMIGANITLNW